MKLQIFTIFDKKALVHLSPFYLHTKGEALRTLDDLVNDVQSRVNKHPSDYQLFKIGEWDDLTGVTDSLPNPEFIEEASNYVKKGSPRV